MKYIQGIIGLPLILSIDKSGNIKSYVDAAFVVHKNTKILTGGFMTTGTGEDYVQPIQKKTNSWTEAKLVGVDNVLTQVLVTQYLLK